MIFYLVGDLPPSAQLRAHASRPEGCRAGPAYAQCPLCHTRRLKFKFIRGSICRFQCTVADKFLYLCERHFLRGFLSQLKNHFLMLITLYWMLCQLTSHFECVFLRYWSNRENRRMVDVLDEAGQCNISVLHFWYFEHNHRSVPNFGSRNLPSKFFMAEYFDDGPVIEV